MSRSVHFKVDYNKHLILTMDEAAKIANILDGKTVYESEWIRNADQTHFVEQEIPYVTRLEFADPNDPRPITEAEAEALRDND